MSDIQRTVCGGSYCCNQVALAIRRGELKRPAEYSCADCGGSACQYDHRDYNYPLKVDPVCRSCNIRRGKAIPRRWSAEQLREMMLRAAHRQRIVPWAVEWCHDQIERVCGQIEKYAGIPRHELRPDLYPEGRA